MYLCDSYIYYGSDGQQRCSRGKFLILMECRERQGVSAIVRKVSLRQLGAWMMGKARIGRKWYSLSGCYGSDGLLLEVDADAWDKGTPLPENIYQLWAKDDGHNSAGRNGPVIRKWAIDNLL